MTRRVKPLVTASVTTPPFESSVIVHAPRHHMAVASSVPAVAVPSSRGEVHAAPAGDPGSAPRRSAARSD